MLIRNTLLFVLIAGAGCVENSIPLPLDASVAPSAATAPESSKRPLDAFCDHRKFACRPNDARSRQICDDACLFPSHCQDYYPSDHNWCVLHPDSYDRYGRHCDQWGNPDWLMTCVAGAVP
jgi:hypothetical protein